MLIEFFYIKEFVMVKKIVCSLLCLSSTLYASEPKKPVQPVKHYQELVAILEKDRDSHRGHVVMTRSRRLVPQEIQPNDSKKSEKK
jgi:hypothetical protein